MKNTLKITGLFIMLIVMITGPLYGGKLVVASSTQMDELTISSGDEVEIQTGNTVDVDGDITITGTLDMDGTSVVECTGTFTDNGTLEAASGSQITFNGGSQSITGSATGTSNNIPFDKVVFSGGAKTFNPTTSASIVNSLDAGGQNVTIASSKTLTLASGSTTTISGGTWTLTGTLSPNTSSTIAYTSGSAQTALAVSHGNMEHDGSGALSLPANFTVQGTYTNTLGNFTAGSYSLTAGGLVWTAGSVTATPSGAWDIGSSGIDVNGGTFLATSGAFTNAGNWDMTGATAFTPGTGTVVFDGTSAQSVTSAAKPFYSLTNSNTGGIVTVADKLEINASGTMTVDASATLALAGLEFDDNGGTVTNNGTLTMDGDNTLTSGALSIGGSGTTKFTDASGATLSTGFAGLKNVEFNSSGNTFTFSEDMAYIDGDITVASNTTLAMGGYDLTLADGKTVTNNGTWSAPSSGSVFTCTGAATFAGNAMNFYAFSATGAAKTLTFADATTYTVANDLTLTGTSGNEITIQNASNDESSDNTATISNTGGTQSVDYVKVNNVNGTASNFITATNSYALGGVTSYWTFSAIQFVSTGGGNWNTAGTWDLGRVPVSTDNVQISHAITLDVNASIADLLVDAAKTLTFGSSKTLNMSGSVTDNGTIAINDGTLTATGASDINGTVTISTGIYDANNSFDATGGTLTFSGAASLNLGDAVTSLGTMTSNLGTVTYDGTTQTVFSDAYNNLSLSGGTKTLGGAITVAGNLTNASGSTLDAADGSNHAISVAGDWANSGTFTSRAGTVTLNGTANQTLTPGTGAFYNLTLNNTGTDNQSITPGAALDVDNVLTLTDGTLALTGNYNVNIGGNLTIADGAVWSKGTGTTTFDGSGDQTLTDSNSTPNNLGTVVVD